MFKSGRSGQVIQAQGDYKRNQTDDASPVWRTISGSLACFLLLLALLLTAVNIGCFDRQFYDFNYRELRTADTIGISDEELEQATTVLLDYLQNRRDDINLLVTVRSTSVGGGSEQVQMFDAREKAHMKDVKALYLSAMTVRDFSLVIAGLILLLLYLNLNLTEKRFAPSAPLREAKKLSSVHRAPTKRGYVAVNASFASFPRMLRRAYGYALAVFIVLLGFIAVCAAIDFDSFWTHFHELFFRNDLWLLDPTYERLIMMVPGIFFNRLVRRIIIYAVAFILGLSVICFGGCRIALRRPRSSRAGHRGSDRKSVPELAASGSEEEQHDTPTRESFACIFDLDGTLLYTLTDLAGSVNRALDKQGMPAIPLEDYRQLVGNGIRTLCERAVDRQWPLRTLPPRTTASEGELPLMQKQAEAVEVVFETFIKDYEAHCCDTTTFYPGIPERLRQLRTEGLLMAVLSNKADDLLKKVIRHYFPEKELFHIIAGMSDRFPPKPDPAHVLDLAARMGVDPEHVCFIGDSSTDMITANRARMIAVGVTWGFRDEQELRENGARYICHTTDELYELLHSMHITMAKDSAVRMNTDGADRSE